MKKKEVKKKKSSNGINVHRFFDNKLTIGQRSADIVAEIVGSWGFIIFFLVFIVIWMGLNAYVLLFGIWDPYPFILLNFVLSCLAALQAPIILMSQNRQAERDRVNFKYDYQVNRKSEREVQLILKELALIKKHVYENLGVKIKSSNSKKKK